MVKNTDGHEIVIISLHHSLFITNIQSCGIKQFSADGIIKENQNSTTIKSVSGFGSNYAKARNALISQAKFDVNIFESNIT